MRRTTKIALLLALKRLAVLVFGVLCAVAIWRGYKDLATYKTLVTLSVFGGGLIYLIFDYLIGDGGFWWAYSDELREERRPSATKH